MYSRFRRWLLGLGLVAVVLGVILATQLPNIGAAAIIYPYRKNLAALPPPGCESATLKGDGIDLAAWQGKAEGKRRGTLVYLHGIADNRGSSAGVLPRFRKRGFDVIAFDSRAHGASGGDCCTYGYHEKHDLKRVLDTAAPGPIVLIGSSLGGAIALQEAAMDSRVTTVVTAEAFSDLRTVVTERAPFIFTRGTIEGALRVAEKRGRFEVDQASPMAAAPSISVPVFVIHGGEDHATPPAHARRIYDSLAGPKRLLLVPGAGHNHALRGDEVWVEIEQWIDSVVPPP